MRIVFLSNFLNHHQVHLADEFYKLFGDDYKFIATMPIPKWLLDSGYPLIERPYVINTYQDEEAQTRTLTLVDNADVVIIGSAPENFVTKRINSNKLTFRYSERWFKNKPWFLTGPKGWLHFYKNHIRYRNKPLYMLCASAYTATDVNTIGAYKGKCYKWGYFTHVQHTAHELHHFNPTSKSDKLKIMWCSRFIKWKHPELPIMLASRLKQKGYNFVIDMFGGGELLEQTKALANRLHVSDCVNFCGNHPNHEILNEMRSHDIFLFTSDKNEGWGVVLNEAMSSMTVVVGSHLIGAAPYLIQDGVNGCIFKSQNICSLEEKVRYLIDNPEQRIILARNAYLAISNEWSPGSAVKNFLQLVTALQCGDDSLIPVSGLCSKA